MDYTLYENTIKSDGGCVILGLFTEITLRKCPNIFSPKQKKEILRLFSQLSEEGDYLWQSDFNGVSLLLIHCGQREIFTEKKLKRRISELCAALKKERYSTAVLCLPPILYQTSDEQLQQMILHIDAEFYQLTEYKTKNPRNYSLTSLSIYLPKASSNALQEARIIAEGVAYTRRLADLPANVCTPIYLGEQALSLAEISNLTTKVYGLAEIKHLNMGGLLGVSQGSSIDPRFIEIQYNGDSNKKPIILVGKGITFDSGGLSIKPAILMDEMKYDMAGAATVLGVLKICATLALPITVIGLIAAAENLPSGSALKPGDIIKSMSGQTIEVLNTDAEGRLILADALTYAERFNPEFVIDIATLTGAIIIALGCHATGFMTDDEDLAKLILLAASKSQDEAWRMPLDESYQEALESPLADMINASFDRSAGAITAACFLSRFTSKYRWAHLDIAGTAWISGKNRKATGRPVPLLIELLRHVASY